MGHGAPLKLHHGSAITGREHLLYGGYELDLQEGVAINKEVTGLGFPNLAVIYPSKVSQADDRIMGKCLDHRGDGSLNAGSCGGVGAAAGFTQLTKDVGTFCISFMLRSDPTVAGFIFKGYGAAAGATRYYLVSSPAGAVYPTLGATGLTTFTPTKNKWHRACVTWEGTYGEWFIDGISIGSSNALAMLSDSTELQIGVLSATGTQGFNGKTSDPLWVHRRFTAEDAKRDYLQYARRAWYQESFRSAHVSSMANPSGQPLENTRWIIDETPNGGSDFRIVDAPELERLAGFAGAKAMAKLSAGGWAYLPLQYAGLHAPTPEAAYGTFDFWIRHDGNADTYAHFIADTNSPNIVSGYAIRVTNTERLQLRRFTGGGGATILRTVVDYFPVDTWTRVTVTRRYDGEFWVLINGVPIDNADIDVGTNPVTDNTHQTGSYVIAEIGEYDEFGMLSHRWGVAA
jgi:hypothetical protein